MDQTFKQLVCQHSERKAVIRTFAEGRRRADLNASAVLLSRTFRLLWIYRLRSVSFSPHSTIATVLGDFSMDVQFLILAVHQLFLKVKVLYFLSPLAVPHPGLCPVSLILPTTLIHHLMPLWPSSFVSLPPLLSSTPAIATTNHVPTSAPGLRGRLPEPHRPSPLPSLFYQFLSTGV